jgi:hypothetical protein
METVTEVRNDRNDVGHMGPDLLRRLTPLRAVRSKCLDCSGYQASEVQLCTVRSCPLFPYRRGGRPTEEDLDTFRAAYREFVEGGTP